MDSLHVMSYDLECRLTSDTSTTNSTHAVKLTWVKHLLTFCMYRQLFSGLDLQTVVVFWISTYGRATFTTSDNISFSVQ